MIKINEGSILGGTLPRVYVNKIVINDGSAFSSKRSSATNKRTTSSSLKLNERPTSVNLELYAQDLINVTRPSATWALSPSLRSRIRMVVVQSTNKSLTQTIQNSGFSLSTLQAYEENTDYQIKYEPLTYHQHVPESARFMSISAGKQIYSLIKNVSFEVSYAPQHIAIFAFCDLAPALGESGKASQVHGIVTVEKVVDNYFAVKNGAIYRDGANRIWAGAIHNHPQRGWMEGAFHSDAPHGALVRQATNNFKLVDLRILKTVDDLKIDLTKKQTSPTSRNTAISDLYMARNNDGHMVGSFSLDKLGFLIQNSKFGNLLATSPSAIQEEILASSHILSFKIVRELVTNKVATNKLGSAAIQTAPLVTEGSRQVVVESSDSNGRLLSARRYTPANASFNEFVQRSGDAAPPSGLHLMGGVEEIRVQNGGTTRSFIINDALLNARNGAYRYKLECTLRDGSFKFLNNRLEDLQEVIYQMKGYLATASKEENFDTQTGCFRTTFIDAQLDSTRYLIPAMSQLSGIRSAIRNDPSDRAVQPWIASIIKYIETLDILTNISTVQKRALARTVYAIVSPASGTPSGIRLFIRYMESLEARLSKLVTKKVSHSRDKSDAYRGDRTKETLEIINTFTDFFDASVIKDTGFEYFEQNRLNNGMLSVTRQEYVGALQEQIARIGNNSYDISTLRSNFQYITDDAARAFYSTSQDLGYVSPGSVELTNNKVSLWTSDSLDYTSISAVIENMARDATGEKLNVQPAKSTVRLLTEIGKGPSENRVKKLNELYSDNALSSGILLSTMPKKSNGSQKTTASEEFLGKTNKFTSEPPPSEDNTVPQVPPKLADALSVLNKVLSSQKSTSNGAIQPSSAVSNISFDLTKENNFVIQELGAGANFKGESEAGQELASKIDALPAHIKKLALRQTRFYDDKSGALSTGEDSQADGFVYNFGMIRVIEYLAGYKNNNLKDPIWIKVNAGILNSLTANIVCRIRKIVIPSVNIGVFDSMDKVPIYNEYFILRGAAPRRPKMRNINTKINLAQDASSYQKGSFLASAESDIFVSLLKFEAEQKDIYYQSEYVLSSPPLASRQNGADPEMTPATPKQENMDTNSKQEDTTTMRQTRSRQTSTRASNRAAAASTYTGGGTGGGY